MTASFWRACSHVPSSPLLLTVVHQRLWCRPPPLPLCCCVSLGVELQLFKYWPRLIWSSAAPGSQPVLLAAHIGHQGVSVIGGKRHQQGKACGGGKDATGSWRQLVRSHPPRPVLTAHQPVLMPRFSLGEAAGAGRAMHAKYLLMLPMMTSHGSFQEDIVLHVF